MATNPIPVRALNKIRAARDYPNFNGLLGCRLVSGIGLFGPILAIDTPYIFGRVPAGAFITQANAGCTIAFVGTAVPILDIGLRNPNTGVVTRAALLAGFDLSTPGVGYGSVAAGLGLQAEEMEVVATLGGTGTPTAGGFNALVQFVTKND
jgi:hypothetical protein